jgi:hypothetical protein
MLNIIRHFRFVVMYFNLHMCWRVFKHREIQLSSFSVSIFVFTQSNTNKQIGSIKKKTMNSNIIYKIENKHRVFQQKRHTTGYMRDLFDKVLIQRPVTSLIDQHHQEQQLFNQKSTGMFREQLPVVLSSSPTPTKTPKTSSLKRPDGGEPKTAKKTVKFESVPTTPPFLNRIAASATKTSLYAPPPHLPSNQISARSKGNLQSASMSSSTLLRSLQNSNLPSSGSATVSSNQNQYDRYKSVLKDSSPIDSGRQQQQQNSQQKLANIAPGLDKNLKTALRTSDSVKLSSILNLRGEKVSSLTRKVSFAKVTDNTLVKPVMSVEKKKELKVRFRKAARSLIIILKMLTIQRTANDKMKKFEFKDGYYVSKNCINLHSILRLI